jgi:hypothetical protein
VKSKWLEIVSIWVAVALVTIGLLTRPESNDSAIEASFGAILAGSIATVSMVQLFKAQPEGFVRRLIYVGGGSYLILAVATLYLSLKG